MVPLYSEWALMPLMVYIVATCEAVEEVEEFLLCVAEGCVGIISIPVASAATPAAPTCIPLLGWDINIGAPSKVWIRSRVAGIVSLGSFVGLRLEWWHLLLLLWELYQWRWLECGRLWGW